MAKSVKQKLITTLVKQIVEQIKTLLERPVEEVKDEIDALKQQYYKLRKNEIEEAHRAYNEKPEEERGGFRFRLIHLKRP